MRYSVFVLYAAFIVFWIILGHILIIVLDGFINSDIIGRMIYGTGFVLLGIFGWLMSILIKNATRYRK